MVGVSSVVIPRVAAAHFDLGESIVISNKAPRLNFHMGFLVDPNDLSEPAKLRPAKRSVAWLRQREGELSFSAITTGELPLGFERLATWIFCAFVTS